MKRLVFLTNLVLLTSLLLAQSQITYYEIEIPRYLDPVYGGATVDGQRAVSLMFRTLYGYDRARNFVPRIAESNPVITPEGNMLVTIKPNLKWHNGQPVTAKNVVRSVEMLKHAGTDYQDKEGLSQFTPIERNERTVEFVNNPHNPASVYALEFPILPTDYLASVSLQRNSEYTQRKPIGNGPFAIESVEKDKLIFKRFDDFARATLSGEHTNIDKIICKEVKNKSVWAQDLRSGLVDILVDVPQHEIDNLFNLQNIRLEQYKNYSIEMLAFNMKNKRLTEQFVRLAMIYGTNRMDMINGFLGHHADLATGPYPCNSYYDWQQAAPRKFNPAYAMKILEEAGCVKGSDGIFRFNGQKLSFRFLHISEDPLMALGMFSDFQKQMKDIGIEIQEPTIKDYYAYVDDINQKNFDIAMVKIFYGESLDISSTYRRSTNFNFMSYQNTIVDQLFDQLESTTDPLQKKLIGNNIHKAIYDDPPAIFLWTRHSFSAYNSKHISNFSVHPINFFYLVDEWRYNK